jgi:hypothetical protein
MDSKKDIKEDVKSVLMRLHQKIDSLKEKVDQLCETTNCLHLTSTKVPPKKEKKRKQN